MTNVGIADDNCQLCLFCEAYHPIGKVCHEEDVS